MRSTHAWSLAAIVALVLVVPSASACHAAPVAQAGVVVDDGGPALAEISFYPDCEGPVDVTITTHDLVTGATTSETIDADLQILSPLQDCLPLDFCQAALPPSALLTLQSDDGRLSLTGVANNALHATQSLDLAGTYDGYPASFNIVKPV